MYFLCACSLQNFVTNSIVDILLQPRELNRLVNITQKTTVVQVTLEVVLTVDVRLYNYIPTASIYNIIV